MELKDKVCLVTGAAGGIGLALARSLLQRGASCLIVDVNYKEGEKQAVELGATFGEDKVQFMRVDVTSHTNFEEAFVKCFDVWGGLDIVVNNAGINGEINWESQFQINLYGVIRGSKLALKYMGKGDYGNRMSTKKGGIVLNISSIQGLLTWPAMPTYSAVKSGLITYTRCAGHQLEYEQHGVKMICICPPAVRTPILDYLSYCGLTDAGQKFIKAEVPKLDIQLEPEELGEAGAKIIVSEDTKSGSVWFIQKSGEEAFEVPNENTWENLMKHQVKK